MDGMIQYDLQYDGLISYKFYVSFIGLVVIG